MIEITEKDREELGSMAKEFNLKLEPKHCYLHGLTPDKYHAIIRLDDKGKIEKRLGESEGIDIKDIDLEKLKEICNNFVNNFLKEKNE